MRIPDLRELLVRKLEKEKKVATQNQTPNPDTVLLGPLPYNRFLGNPPAGETPEKAFEAEMGYPWLVQLNMQPVLDKLQQLEVKNKDLQSQVTKLQAEVTNLQHTQAQTQNTKHK